VAFALGYMLAIKLAAALLHRLVSGRWPAFGTEPLALIPFAVALSTPFQAGEELGWRGFALPRLGARLGLVRASLLLGLVWAVWHLPLFFVRGSDTFGQSFVVYMTQVIAVSVAMAMLYVRSDGGLFLPMLFHSAVNNTKDVVPSATPGAHDVFSPRASLEAWLGAGLLWVCTAFIVAWLARTEPARRSQYSGWID
jgi:membrane protease YdiL (CAAX protease family)